MKYLCFGYLDVKNWETKSAAEQMVMVDDCFAYDDILKKDGHWVYGNGIKSPKNCATLEHQNGKVTITDGPYAETKELLGGLLILEARDMNQALQLISKHPGVKVGKWEIRPVEDIAPMLEESEKRRAKKQ
jgi:hypothetical protein